VWIRKHQQSRRSGSDNLLAGTEESFRKDGHLAAIIYLQVLRKASREMEFYLQSYSKRD
jgi:hypothetical protein